MNILPIDIFKVLIETLGYDVNAQDDGNDTPLHVALKNFYPDYGGDINILTYLINQKNVDANIKGEYGSTILHTACEKINDLPLEIFKVLIETYGADINAQDKYRDTPFHDALDRFNPNDGGDITVFMYFLNQMGVNANIKGKDGYTILHLVCICEIAYSDYGDDDDDHDDDEDDYSSDEGLEDSIMGDKLNQEADTNLCRIVEAIVEKCVQQVLDDTTF
jgi:ankyrin repeat protein